MPCKCACGRDIDCGAKWCDICYIDLFENHGLIDGYPVYPDKGDTE